MTRGAEQETMPDRIPSVQTVVQLFEQLQRQGYPAGDLRLVRSACGAAVTLFSGRLHGSGKPYLAHCAGAAGALAALGMTADVVAAGLVHGAYMWGDFGPWGVSLRLRRRHLRHLLGGPVEALVHGFHTRPWNLGALTALRGQLTSLTPTDRSAVLMRLASDLDNLRHTSLLYYADAERRYEDMRRRGPLMIGVADDLGFPSLGRALGDALEETEAGGVPPQLRSDLPTGALLPPASARLRYGAVLCRAVASLRRPLR